MALFLFAANYFSQCMKRNWLTNGKIKDAHFKRQKITITEVELCETVILLCRGRPVAEIAGNEVIR